MSICQKRYKNLETKSESFSEWKFSKHAVFLSEKLGEEQSLETQ